MATASAASVAVLYVVEFWPTAIERVPNARAEAQQQTIYGPDGRVVGRTTVDSSGTRTTYGPDGKTLTRESTDSSGAKTIFDAKSGKIIGRESPQR